MKRILTLFLVLAALLTLAACSDSSSIGIIGGADGPTAIIVGEEVVTFDDEAQPETTYDPSQTTTSEDLDPEGWYYSAEDVAWYLIVYDELPANYITKDEARDLGWEGGSVEDYAPGCAIGGDRFGNREGLLPEAHTYYECDIDTDGQTSRGACRLVFCDHYIYYTDDHYESFELLYEEQ